MVSDRMAVVLELLDGAPRRREAVEAASVRAAAVLGVDGVCAGLSAGRSGTVPVWGLGAVGAELEELQFTLGEGPGPDAAGGAVVLVPDLAVAETRWPAFTSAAAALGVRAVFAWPLRIGAINLGTLVAHRAAAGPLAEETLADAFALADAVTVLMLQQRHSSTGFRPPGTHPPRSDGAPLASYRAGVYQAVGMISVQLGVELAEALVRLRAYAYAEGRPIGEVAAQVIARRLRFDELEQ